MNAQHFNTNQNGFQQDLFIDDSKDLHYTSQHGGHSTEFTASSSHGSGGSGGSGSGGSGSGGSGSGGSSHGQSKYEIID